MGSSSTNIIRSRRPIFAGSAARTSDTAEEEKAGKLSRTVVPRPSSLSISSSALWRWIMP